MERFAPRYDARALTFLQMATSFVGLHRHRASRSASSRCRADGDVWCALVVTGVFAGALGYLVATWVQSRTTAARAALVFTLEAPFAALFGVLLAGEVLGWVGLDRLRRDARRHRRSPSRPRRRRCAGSSPARAHLAWTRSSSRSPRRPCSARCRSRCASRSPGGAPAAVGRAPHAVVATLAVALVAARSSRAA